MEKAPKSHREPPKSHREPTENAPRSRRELLAPTWPPTVQASCPFCGETTEVPVDEGGGHQQSYIEDCIVCCRPSLVHLAATDDGDVSVWLERGDG